MVDDNMHELQFAPEKKSNRQSISVKVSIRDSNGRILMLRRADESNNHPGFWDLPGGKLDRGEDPNTALLREALEETGLTISAPEFRHELLHEFDRWTIRYMLFESKLAIANPTKNAADIVELSDEHSEARWFTDAELSALEMPPGVRALLRL